MKAPPPDWSLYRSFLSVIRTGSLSAAARERLLPKAFSLELEVWIAMHEDLRSSARCRVVADALAAGLAAYAE